MKSRRLDADRVDADVLVLELLEGGVERRGAADVVAVGQQHDARGAERRAPDLGDRRGERVVDVRPLGELRRLREHCLAPWSGSVVSGSATVGFALKKTIESG